MAVHARNKRTRFLLSASSPFSLSLFSSSLAGHLRNMTCNDNLDCSYTDECYQRKCKPMAMFSDCSSASPYMKQCPNHTFCHKELSRCVPNVDWERPANATCSSSIDCAVTEYCHRRNSVRTCLPRAKANQPCHMNELHGVPCLNHYACVDGLCLAPCRNDRDCQYTSSAHFLNTNSFCSRKLNGYCTSASKYARSEANLALILPLVFGIIFFTAIVAVFSYRIWKRRKQARIISGKGPTVKPTTEPSSSFSANHTVTAVPNGEHKAPADIKKSNLLKDDENV